MPDFGGSGWWHQVRGWVCNRYRRNDNVEFDRGVVGFGHRFGERGSCPMDSGTLSGAMKAGDLCLVLDRIKTWEFGASSSHSSSGGQASTVTTPARLARMSGATTLFLELHGEARPVSGWISCDARRLSI
jgi:hypothetical protein